MRVAFLLAILFASGFYTYMAFEDLHFLSATGRLGPGFFPRIIGLALIACCVASLWRDLRLMRGDETDSPFWGIVGVMAVLSGTLVFLFNILGGTLAMVVFLLVSLSILNRGHPVQNVAVSIVLPVGIYFLFDVWLNAAMPEGIVSLPL